MKYIPLLFLMLLFGCKSSNSQNHQKAEITTPVKREDVTQPKAIKTGAEVFFEELNEKWAGDPNKEHPIALVVNQTSQIGDKHIVDSLLALGFHVTKIFAPEHGFRGTADAGEKIKDGKDPKTGLPIISLYGKNKKPTAEMFEDVEMVIFDIQDVGARFYTYISTMFYVMQACAEHQKFFMVFDRPNPNGHYVDGPVLKSGFESFVGVHQVPVVHGMTIGEYATMINREGWLEPERPIEMKVFKCENYDHKKRYDLPVKPSPNLPNTASIFYYPSLCFFEGTVVSVGRGTDSPFQIYGHPGLKGDFQFTPKPSSGAKYPKLEGKTCNGFNLSDQGESWVANQLNLKPLISAYQELKDLDKPFFNKNLFFDKLAGTDELRKQIEKGMSEQEIRATWQSDLNDFKAMRKKYLLYEDFE